MIFISDPEKSFGQQCSNDAHHECMESLGLKCTGVCR